MEKNRNQNFISDYLRVRLQLGNRLKKERTVGKMKKEKKKKKQV